MKWKRTVKMIRVGIFVPEGLESMGSVRIRGFNLMAPLSALFDVVRFFGSVKDGEADVVIVPQRTAALFPWEEIGEGTRVIFDAVEMERAAEEKRLFSSCCEMADVVTAGSLSLCGCLRDTYRTPVTYLPDMVEVPYVERVHAEKEKIGVFWYGFALNHELVAPVFDLVSDLSFIELEWMSDHPGATHPWDLNRWRECMSRTDVGIAPAFDSGGFHSVVDFKGSHKITSFMAQSVPVIASPLSEYRTILRDGENGFVARTLAEWERALDALRSADVRNRLAREAYRTALLYSPEAIAGLYGELMDEVTGRAPSARFPGGATGRDNRSRKLALRRDRGRGEECPGPPLPDVSEVIIPPGDSGRGSEARVSAILWAYRRDEKQLAVYIKSEERLSRLRRIFLHLYPEDISILPPGRRRYGFLNMDHDPTFLPGRGKRGMFYRDRVGLEGVSPGRYRVVMGFLGPGQERFALPTLPGQEAELGWIEV